MRKNFLAQRRRERKENVRAQGSPPFMWERISTSLNA
jgi:hypothetical protein